MKLVEQIQRWPLARLSPYAHNARIHSAEQVAQIAESIKTFGFNNPILVDAQGGIIAGHGRFAAATKLGLTEAPVILLDHLTDRERRAYIIADNKLAENATWDDAVLAAELAALNEEEFDLSILGFDDRELEKLLATEDDDGRADECPPVPEAATTALGDVWLLGRHRVLCGDATDGAAVARLMAGAKAHMVFTDPPYNQAQFREMTGVSDLRPNSYGALKDSQWDRKFRFIDVNAPILSILADACSVYVCMSEFIAPDVWAWMGKWADYYGYCVWCKPNPMPSLGKAHWTWATELIGYATRGKRAFQFPDDGHALNWWQIQVQQANRVHPTQKPVEVPERAITHSSVAGNRIADVFLGSGSTLIACEKTKRICYGMELSPEYCDVIVTRWQEYAGKQATLDGDGRTFAEVRAARLPATVK